MCLQSSIGILGSVLIPYSGFLKERLFGLSNPQGNHGESVKEAHFHLDNTPTVGAFRWIQLGRDADSNVF